jgi:hypothetical protein
MPCCDAPEHVTNARDPDFLGTLISDLTKLKHSLHKRLTPAVVLDGIELICGSGCGRDRVEQTLLSGRASDPSIRTPTSMQRWRLTSWRRWRPIPASLGSLRGSGNERGANLRVSPAPAPLPAPEIGAVANRDTRAGPGAAAVGAAVAAAAEEGEYRMPTQHRSALIFWTTTRDADVDPIWALPQEAARLEATGEEATWNTSGARLEADAGLAGEISTSRSNTPHLAESGHL